LQSIAQTQLTGTVLSSADKLPLQGVTVTVKGTSRSATTGSLGTFSISADSSSILVFSHIGYALQEVQWNNRAGLTVLLQPSTGMLSEVTVSTGYQEIPNERTAGSFGKISN